MSQIVEQSRRHDSRMAVSVDCGLALLTLAGRDEASRYLRSCGVPADVIGRVLTTPIARRPHGTHLLDRRRSSSRIS
jgi:hypothetical protein